MKSSIISSAKWLFAVLYIFFIYTYLYRVVNLQLHYHIQQPAFLTTADFFRQYLSIPGMPSEYIANFLSQFFFIKWLGPLVVVGIGVLFMWFGYLIFNTFNETGSGYMWMLLPVCFLIALFNSYNFPFEIVIRIIFSYIAVWIFLYAINKKLNPYFPYIILALGVYYIAGSGPFMIFSASAVIITFYLKHFKKGILFLLTVLAISIFIPYIAYKFLFNITIKDAYFLIVPHSPKILRYEADKILFFFNFYLPAAIFLLYIANIGIKKWQQRKQALTGPIHLNKRSGLKTANNISINSTWDYFKKWLTVLIPVLLIIGVTYVSINSTKNKHKKNVVRADFYCYHEKWNKAIRVVLSDDDYYDLFLNYFYNRAIDNNGHYFDMYFNYPQLYGSECLFPDRLAAVDLPVICSDYYFDLGYISQAHHWAYETQSVMPYNPRILKRLVLTNLIFGNYGAAENILGILNKTFFCNDFVTKYMPYIKDTSLISSDKLIMEKRAFLPKNAIFTASIVDCFYNLIDSNGQNKRAMEHLAMYFLLTNQFDKFIEFMPKVMKFYGVIPRVFEEAILVYLDKSNKQKNLNEYNISNKTLEGVMGFYQIMHGKYGGDQKAALPELYKLYGNSYLYYLHYNSPLVTGLELNLK